MNPQLAQKCPRRPRPSSYSSEESQNLSMLNPQLVQKCPRRPSSYFSSEERDARAKRQKVDMEEHSKLLQAACKRVLDGATSNIFLHKMVNIFHLVMFNFFFYS